MLRPLARSPRVRQGLNVMVSSLSGLALLAVAATGCRQDAPTDRVRVSGHVEADDVQLAAEVGGRILELSIAEGDRVLAAQVIARLDTRDAQLTVARLRADRAQADAQLRLLLAGSRQEDIRQAAAQVTAAEADISAAESELLNAQADLDRYEALLKANAGSRKARDDAQARRDVARDRVSATRQRATATAEAAAGVKAGARREEIDAARARVAIVDAQIAAAEKTIADATVTAPAAGSITSKLVNVGEIVAPRAPLAVMTDLDHAWAEVFVDEPLVPRIVLGQPATLYTDAGGSGLPGKVTFISPKAEFTPRNVQTAEERSRLVYRIKVTTDNSKGVLKPGMPIEAELPLR